jgi:hypothetical protein
VRNRNSTPTRRTPRGKPRFTSLALEQLEGRLVMDAHAHLAILLGGQLQAIPANIGVSNAGAIDQPHTLDATGLLHIHGTPTPQVTVADFFRVWRTNAGLAGNNPNAVFDQTHILDRTVDATNEINMYVNGAPNFQYEAYVPRDGDQIVISLEPVPVRHQPTLAPIDTQTMLAGQTLHVPLDGADHEDQPLRYTVTSSNANVTAELLDDNPGLRVNVRIGGASEVLPNFSLPDLNPNSTTVGQNIGPSFYSGQVSAYYFADPG